MFISLIKLPYNFHNERLFSLQDEFLYPRILFKIDGIEGQPVWIENYHIKFQLVSLALRDESDLTVASEAGTAFLLFDATLRMISATMNPLSKDAVILGGMVTTPFSSCSPELGMSCEETSQR